MYLLLFLSVLHSHNCSNFIWMPYSTLLIVNDDKIGEHKYLRVSITITLLVPIKRLSTNT